MKIYADICTLCRPFDDQNQPRIWLETHALCVILNLVELQQISLVRSPIHDLENSRSPTGFRRGWVDQCLTLANQQIPLNATIKQRALDLEFKGVGSLDALHAACAEEAGCEALLTCDDRFRKRYNGPIKVLNPTDFVVSYFEQQP